MNNQHKGDSALDAVLESYANGVFLRTKVVPGASHNRIAGVLGDRLKLQVKAPPDKGKANRAVVRLLADALHVSESSLELIRGSTSARKDYYVQGLSCDEALASLRNLLSGV